MKILFITFCWIQCAHTQETGSTELDTDFERIDGLFSSGLYEEVISESSVILNKSNIEYLDSAIINLSLQRVRASYSLGKYKEAITFGLQAETLIASDNINALTDFWKFISPSYIQLKDKANAILYLNKTLNEEKTLLKSDPKKIINAYKDLGSLYSSFGDDELSKINFIKGIELFNSANLENTGIRGDLYLNFGANYITKRENDTAFHYLDLAKKDYLNEYKPTHRKLGSVNFNMAVVQDHRGYVFEAMELLKEAEVSWNNAYGENHPRMAYIQINRGQMALKVGDYEKALNSGFKALDILSTHEASDPGLMRSSLSTIGDAYFKLGDYNKALQQHELAFDVTLDTYGEKSEFTYSSAANIADLYQYQSNFEKAQPYIDLVLKNVDHNSNMHYLSILHLMSKSEFHKGNFDKGLEYLDLAISLSQAEGKDFKDQKIILLLNKAEKKISIDHLAEANLILEELKVMLEITEQDHLTPLYSTPHYIAFYNHIGQWNLKKYKQSNDIAFLNDGHESFNEAIDIYKNLIFSIGDQNTQFSLAKHADNLMSKAMETIYLLNKHGKAGSIEDALAIIESGKNLALKQRLLENSMINSGNLPPELRANEIKVNTEIAELKSEIMTYQLDTEEDQWENILKARRELNEKIEVKEKLIQLYKSKYPKYYDLKFDNTKISLEDIVSNLGSDQTILNLSIADSLLYALILSPNKSEFLKIELPDQFADIVNNFHKSISSHNTAMYTELLKKVSNAFGEISHTIDLLGTKKLLIIPDEYLAYIPFEILQFDQNYTLGDKFDIHYSWSAKEVKSLDKNRGSKSEILAIAPTYLDQYNEGAAPDAKLFAELVRSGNVHLPGAAEEVSRIKKIYPTKIVRGAEASEANFKNQAKDHSILHLSMHGLVDNNNPLLSSLVFTPEIDTVENGILEAWEIYNMNLNAELVVLSSCNTGYGKLEKSEGVMSLSRAFAHAGVPSAIMTLWQVPDQSTSEIMVNFYQNLKDGLPKSEALRNAKKTYLDNTIVPQKKHPFYWAGLVLIGNNDPIHIDKTSYEWMFGILSFAILLIVYLVHKKKQV